MPEFAPMLSRFRRSHEFWLLAVILGLSLALSLATDSFLTFQNLFDLLTSIKVSLQEPAWTGFGVEAYIFASVVYFAFCFTMSRYSQRLERGLGPGRYRRNRTPRRRACRRR